MNKLFAHLDAHFDAHLDRVRAYVRQPSISGEGRGMEAMAALVADSIRELGGTAEIVPTPGWPVVHGAVDAGRPKTLLLYLFRRVLNQPFATGGLGHGGRPHSPNEYATLEGMRLFERSVAGFLHEFAEG